MSPSSDAEDIQAVVRGDRTAFTRLYDRHEHRVHAIGYRILGDRVGAEDVTQETFMRIWKHAGSWSPEKASFATWISRIASNSAIDLLRKRREAPTDFVPERPDPSPAANPHVSAAFTDARRRLLSAMQGLPDRQRVALSLVMDGRLSNAEAAAAMDIGEQAVESLLARARRALRKALEGEKDELLGSFDHD